MDFSKNFSGFNSEKLGTQARLTFQFFYPSILCTFSTFLFFIKPYFYHYFTTWQMILLHIDESRPIEMRRRDHESKSIVLDMGRQTVENWVDGSTAKTPSEVAHDVACSIVVQKGDGWCDFASCGVEAYMLNCSVCSSVCNICHCLKLYIDGLAHVKGISIMGQGMRNMQVNEDFALVAGHVRTLGIVCFNFEDIP
ncbi:hypothetical protein TELCIR_08242 [Teladorsagia circumcincta]|uniref:Uncharacterized protein n=1 Tax=Teladorsagia circumcincta TaxID=45464 RepID=A0A2G9UI53_TELCI|nr:hypothetical protein TELCIR_08242 [Teladorsagia circumcincta]